MQIEKELCDKFPAVLRNKLLNNEIELPETTQFEYEAILTYRAVERKPDDYQEVTLDDFKSYYELRKKPRSKPRGMRNFDDLEKDPHYYGVSTFLKKEIVEQKMGFPNPRKKIAMGYVHSAGGPQDTNIKDQHVCWWLYEGADVSGYKLIEDENNG